uniref:Uncharacterized protein n=1 Tax=Heterorhabditis bacteriophora TaxID=37862 RepID=A0A1I7WJP9_HETBA
MHYILIGRKVRDSGPCMTLVRPASVHIQGEQKRILIRLFDFWIWVRSRVCSYLPRVVPALHCCWEWPFPIWGTVMCAMWGVIADGVTGLVK